MDDAPASSRRTEAVLVVVATAGALAVGLWAIRPIHRALVGYDTASSVVYFERIIRGEPLERFLGTTPKPLLTLVDGVLHGLTNDWRPIAWVALVVYALAIGAAVLLATRVSGSVAGAFVGASLIASPGLLQDASQAYSVSWAWLALCIAGLAMTRPAPRYLSAGLALALGGLARQELILVSGVAALLVVVHWALAARARRTPPPRGARGLLLGLAAVPITGLHDVLLAGDPFYTLKVPAIGAVGHDVGGVQAAIDAVVGHSAANLGLVALAIVGLVALARGRAWPSLIGLSTMALGVAAVVLVVGARGMIVLDRYAFPIELALIMLAGSGLGAIGMVAMRAVAARRATVLVAVLAAISTALLVAPRIAPLDRAALARIETERRAARDYATLLPSLRIAVDAAPGLRRPPDRRDPYTRDTTGVTLLVSPRLLPQVLVDLDLRLDRVVTVSGIDPNVAPPPAGSLVLHFARLDSGEIGSWSEVGSPTVRYGATLVPVDRVGRRAWLVRIDPVAR